MQAYLDILNHFADKLDVELPSNQEVSSGVDLVIDRLMVALLPGKIDGSLLIELPLGLLLRPIRKEHLQSLMESNFLGIGVGGCTLALNEEGTLLSIKVVTSASTPPQEAWEWLHRVISVGRGWMAMLSQWDEFVPLATPPQKDETYGYKA